MVKSGCSSVSGDPQNKATERTLDKCGFNTICGTSNKLHCTSMNCAEGLEMLSESLLTLRTESVYFLITSAVIVLVIGEVLLKMKH